LKPDNASDTSGTPGYMAPEVLFHQNHGIAVDYYALGVMAYEVAAGQVFFNLIALMNRISAPILANPGKSYEKRYSLSNRY